MKKLETILSCVEGLRELRGNRALGVRAIRYDSRRVEPGDVFVAINGRDDHGIEYAPEAIDAGAAVVVTDAPERMPQSLMEEQSAVTMVVVDDARLAMAEMSNALLDYPARKLKVFGVTGTNGKTTTTFMIRQLLEAAGIRTGIIGTLGKYLDRFIPTGYTTPEAPELVEILDEMVTTGYDAVAMEVSSHALALHRVAGIRFHGAVFTNLTQDHLDFHPTMREYHDAKKLLFDNLDAGRAAVVNIDDVYGDTMVADSYASVYRYGVGDSADARITEVELGAQGSRWTLRLSERLGGGRLPLRSSLVGDFNVSNVTAALTLALAQGIDRDLLAGAVERLQSVPGRMESIAIGEGATAVVDYAHTPDALENVLSALRSLKGEGGITLVFGCGGDRDRTKRPIMGEIAVRLADRVILTSDNPRSENPEAILDEIMAGVCADTVERVVDRREAIERGLEGAGPGDIVVIAGKGHEDYQIVGAERISFDDREVVRQWVTRRERAHGNGVTTA